ITPGMPIAIVRKKPQRRCAHVCAVDGANVVGSVLNPAHVWAALGKLQTVMPVTGPLAGSGTLPPSKREGNCENSVRTTIGSCHRIRIWRRSTRSHHHAASLCCG